MSSGATVRRAWWHGLRQRWVALAVAIFGLEFMLLWMVSAQGDWGPVSPRAARNIMAPQVDSESVMQGWLWLHHPGVMLSSTPEDFSGAGWLVRRGVDVAFESVKPASQPLPFQPLPQVAPGSLPDLRQQAALAWEWELPPLPIRLPAVGPLPFPGETTARVVNGLDGWRLRSPSGLPLAPGGSVLAPLVLRVTLDDRGELASPPIVWESSGSPAVDELLMSQALQWRFDRAPDAPPQSGGSSGLILVEWGIVPSTTESPR